MAQIQLGPLASQIAGSIAGTTFQRSGIATQVRRKPLPILRRSNWTRNERGTVAYLSRHWRKLTKDQRDAWQAEADGITWYNRFGDPISGKGYWLYLRLNLALAVVGIPPVDDASPPVTFTPITGLEVVLAPSPKMSLYWTGPDPVPTDQALVVEASPNTSTGVSAVYNTRRYICSLSAGTASGGDIFHFWNARFRQNLVRTQFQHFEVYLLDVKNGWTGPRSRVISHY